MSKKVYLRNGEEVILHKVLSLNNQSSLGPLEKEYNYPDYSKGKTSGQFIIERLYRYTDYDEDGETMIVEPCGIKEVVNEIFPKAPIIERQKDLVAILKETEVKKKELTDIETQIRNGKFDLQQIENTKTDLKKQIINRSELLSAKRLTVFCDYRPHDFQKAKRKENICLNYSIDLYNGELSAWTYSIWEEGHGCIESVNNKYGILVNATDEEILEIGKQIVKDDKDISDYSLKRKIPDEYLTDELKLRKKILLKKEAEESIDRIEGEIKGKQIELSKLKKQTNVLTKI